jgi:hypothetical protein
MVKISTATRSGWVLVESLVLRVTPQERRERLIHVTKEARAVIEDTVVRFWRRGKGRPEYSPVSGVVCGVGGRRVSHPPLLMGDMLQ